MNKIKELREALKITQYELADRIGTSAPQINRLEKGERRLTKEWADRLAPALKTTPQSLLFEETPTVPLIGYVGAGSILHLDDPDQGVFDEVEAPEDATEKTVAVKIEGDCLGSFLNGWTVFYDNEPKAPTQDMINKLCIVWLDDGQVLIKEIRKGGVPGLFSLYSNDAPIYDVIIKKAVIVKSMRMN